MRKLLLLAASTTFLLAAAQPAMAAPDRTIVLDKAMTMEFEAPSAVAANQDNQNNTPRQACGKTPADYCDVTLLDVKVPGKITFSIPAHEPEDLDLWAYKSNAAGQRGDSQVAMSAAATPGPAESMTWSSKAAAAFFVAEIRYFASVGMTAPKVTLKFEPSAAAGAADSDIAKIAASQSAKKLKAFKGTATGASKVDVGLVKTNGGCSELTAGGSFKKIAKTDGKCVAKTFLAAAGTTAWSFKLKKKLAKGSYTLTSRATAAGGGAETTFDKADKNLASFKVK